MASASDRTPEAAERYDVAVVGCGMVGTAAARHLARGGARVCLIGPPERGDRGSATWNEMEIFAAHYDEGRITRRTDPDPVWAALAAPSVERYPEIAAEAGPGHEFYVECGHLAVGPAGSDTVTSRLRNAAALGVEASTLDAPTLAAQFPYLHFPPGSAGVWEPREAGYVSARGLVAAQAAAARRHGAALVPLEASAVVPLSHAGAPGGYAVHTEDGACVHADQVLVAAGAFSNERQLLPAVGLPGEHLQLDLQLCTAQTVHFVLGPEDVERLRGMPSLIYKDASMWAYVLPPIPYPDGTVRLKLGGARYGGVQPEEVHGVPGKRELAGHAEVVEWYRSGGCPAAAAEMEAMLHALVPGLRPLQVLRDACVTTHTPSGHPYIGPLARGLHVATGGNGYAAKSSDEIGRLGALSVTTPLGEPWSPREPLQPEVFVPQCLAPGAASAVLTESWSAAAAGYERELVPRFSPWTREALAAVAAHAGALPEGGAVLVPACGPGQELPPLAALLKDRPILGIDISAGMVARAQQQAAAAGPRVTAVVGDAQAAPAMPVAAVLSVFGLQQLPDPPAALAAWCEALLPGGVAVVCFWPPHVEGPEGPWARYGRLLQRKLGRQGPQGGAKWNDGLVPALPADVEVLEDRLVSREMRWASVGSFWEAMTRAGPWHAMRLRKGDAWMDELRSDFMQEYPEAQGELAHRPMARLLVLRKRPPPARL